MMKLKSFNYKEKEFKSVEPLNFYRCQIIMNDPSLNQEEQDDIILSQLYEDFKNDCISRFDLGLYYVEFGCYLDPEFLFNCPPNYYELLFDDVLRDGNEIKKRLLVYISVVISPFDCCFMQNKYGLGVKQLSLKKLAEKFNRTISQVRTMDANNIKAIKKFKYYKQMKSYFTSFTKDEIHQLTDDNYFLLINILFLM